MTGVYQSFVETVDRCEGRPAVIYLGETLNYIDLLRNVEQFSTGLKSLGLKEGDKIMLYIPNTPQWIISWLAMQKIGAVAVPIAPIYTSRDLRYMGGDSGANTIICADTNFGYVKELKEEGLLKNIIVTRLQDSLPRYKRLIGRAFDRFPKGKVEKGNGVVEFKDLMKERFDFEPCTVDENSPLEILYTGGTTKNPKGVPISHALFLVHPPRIAAFAL